jgi:hypothetical protein
LRHTKPCARFLMVDYLWVRELHVINYGPNLWWSPWSTRRLWFESKSCFWHILYLLNCLLSVCNSNFGPDANICLRFWWFLASMCGRNYNKSKTANGFWKGEAKTVCLSPSPELILVGQKLFTSRLDKKALILKPSMFFYIPWQ